LEGPPEATAEAFGWFWDEPEALAQIPVGPVAAEPACEWSRSEAEATVVFRRLPFMPVAAVPWVEEDAPLVPAEPSPPPDP